MDTPMGTITSDNISAPRSFRKPSMFSLFDLEIERLKREIGKLGAKRVLIQLPEGLKPEGPRLAEIVEKTGVLAIVSADPCYGACDIAVQEAESLGADLIIHFGHSAMQSRNEHASVIYIEAKTPLRLRPAVAKAVPLLKRWKRIGLVTTVQHVDRLGEARDQLLKAGKRVVVGDAGRLKYAGQVIGCDYSNAKAIENDVDAFLFIGGGRFHAIGVALVTSKPTVIADPYERRASSVDSEVQKIVKQRWANINEATEAEYYGVIAGLKSGQKRIEKALQIREKLEKTGKKITMLAVREVTPLALLEFPTIDAFVNTACPRISLDDSTRFQKPVLTVSEALVVAGDLTWEQLLEKGWFEGKT